MSNNLYEIMIGKDGVVTISNENQEGLKSSKLTNVDGLIEMFSGLKTHIETPVLPFGCRKLITTENNDLIIIEHPSRIVPVMKYNDGRSIVEFNNVFIPRSLWAMYVKKSANGKNLYKTNIYLMDQLTPFNENMPLYNWIFNNHSFGYYGVCWGSNNINTIVNSEYSNYSSLISMYFSSVFNNHLEPPQRVDDWHSMIDDESYPRTKPQMMIIMRALQCKSAIPQSCFRPSVSTPGQIIRDFIGGRGNV